MNQKISRKFITVAVSAALGLGGIAWPALAVDSLRIPTFEPPAPVASVSSTARAVPALADLDCDNDLDLILGEADGTLRYFENTGNALTLVFAATASATIDSIDVGERAAPSLVDLDHDGDVDLIVGAADGSLSYFENAGTAHAPNFIARTGTDNPFNGLGVASNAVPYSR